MHHWQDFSASVNAKAKAKPSEILPLQEASICKSYNIGTDQERKILTEKGTIQLLNYEKQPKTID